LAAFIVYCTDLLLRLANGHSLCVLQLHVLVAAELKATRLFYATVIFLILHKLCKNPCVR